MLSWTLRLWLIFDGRLPNTDWKKPPWVGRGGPGAIANLDMAMRVTGHRHGMPLTKVVSDEPTVLTKQSRMNKDPETQMVMDAKALYDALLSEQQNQDDERAALECSLTKEDMEALGCQPRWVPHGKNPADALTKVEGAHFAPMARLLNTSRFCIKEEAEELLERKQTKETLGYVPRPRIAPQSSSSLRKADFSEGEEELDLHEMS